MKPDKCPAFFMLINYVVNVNTLNKNLTLA